MTITEFKKEYNLAKVWKDMDELLSKLDTSGLRSLRDAVVIVKEHTGIDMRQDFMLGIMNAMLDK